MKVLLLHRNICGVPDIVVELIPAAAFRHRKAHVSRHRGHALRQHHARLPEL